MALMLALIMSAAIVSSQDVVMSNWIENKDLTGYEFTQNIIFAYNTNELRCAAKCSFDSQCISWTYSGSNCIGYNSIFTGLGNSVLHGTARYYIRHDCAKQPSDCGELDKATCKSGVYKIYLNNTSGFDVYCEMEKNGGGWTVFQRRMDGTVDFYRKWETYRRGFGTPEKEFWLGNEHLHQLTSQGKYSLRINMKDLDNNEKYATYKQFAVDDEKSVYKLTVGEYQGDAGDSMAFHNGQKFSAKDRDVDVSYGHCARMYKGAWWYGDCHNANLNGQYLKRNHTSYGKGVIWYHWKGHHYSLKGTTMMVRRE